MELFAYFKELDADGTGSVSAKEVFAKREMLNSSQRPSDFIRVGLVSVISARTAHRSTVFYCVADVGP